uniref:Small ribosomal subunit protein uS14c n=1 Tax=Rhodogorgon sp. TaxID=2485824 RepID=A0A3G3MHZ2_9FLOR|nr:ribosomal protein S14 [Rhodogorgon sp.]
MAKQSMIERETKRQKLYKKYKKTREDIKDKIKHTSDFNKQLGLQKKLQKLPRDSSIIRQRKRCWLTGRSRGYYRIFGLSRHVLREMAHECLLPGIKKASW